MVIDKYVESFIVYSEDSIQHALQKINQNKKRLVYSVSESGVLEGIITDGDFRRWVVGVSEINLLKPVSEIANKDYVFVYQNEDLKFIERLFSPKIVSVPIIDNMGRIVAIAWQGSAEMRIGTRLIREDKPVFIIAEIGNNHNGSLQLAKQLIEEAAEAGADCAKFQLRDMESLYVNGGNTNSEDIGAEYTIDLLKRFQLSTEQMIEALNYTRHCGLIPLCTPWDQISLNALSDYGIDGLKISSADLTNHSLILDATRKQKPLIISTGMSCESEIIQTIDLLHNEGASFALLQCNSTYPTPMKDINLAYMKRLQKLSGVVVGYSGHERGYEVCIAAVALGAKIIEKHFTLDREMEGSDHRVSLLPNEFAAMVKSIRNVEQAIGSGGGREISQGERLNREVLAKSLVAKKDIAKNERITADMIEVRSPGRGLQPSRIGELIGRNAYREISKGDLFFESDILGECVVPRSYKFDRPWGIPVRYHDISVLTNSAPLDFVEIHFSYRDLELEPEKYLNQSLDIGLVAHSPELFSGDHLMDLSSVDESYRNRSILELQRVVDRVRNLKKHFPKTEKPLIIVNAGGFSQDSFLSTSERKNLYCRIGEALTRIDADGVEIIPQTMPPFPWHFGGQRYHNLFIDPNEIAVFCSDFQSRICLDISHSKLACNYFGWSLKNFIQIVGPYIAHLHIVDARGHHDEGLQIGEGEVDFQMLGENLSQYAPGIPFIPEIWQGHKNFGEGFWIALDRLEQRFFR